MKTLLLIDANSIIHRSFHALPPLSAPDGKPTGALYGLASALLKVLDAHKPDYVAAAFDRPEPTFRKEKYEKYKAHRPHAPDELVEQLKEAHNIFAALGIKTFEIPRYEADDIIGTLVKKFSQKDIKITILTGDLDTLQLVSGKKIIVQTPKKGISETVFYDEDGVRARYGLGPKQMTDYKGLVGDPSDNIPGIPGIGPKTATKILLKYKNLETALEKTSAKHDGETTFKKLSEFKEQSLFSKELATICASVPIEACLEDVAYKEFDRKKIVIYFKKLGFQTLLKRLGEPVEENAELKTKNNKGYSPRGRPHTRNAPHAFSSAASRGVLSPLFNLPEHITISGSLQLPSMKKKITDGSLIKVSHGWKQTIKDAERMGVEIKGPLFDLGIAGWLLNSDLKDFSLESLKERFLKVRENGKQKNNGELLENLFFVLFQKLEKYGLRDVFENIEMPLVPILSRMEMWGVLLNESVLKSLGASIEQELKSLESEIYKMAGAEFNINSPQQVSGILFEKLNLKTKKKRTTQTGMRSTKEEVLSELRGENEIVDKILTYREGSKILSTYVEPLLAQREEDGRIRTNFIQTGTSTGRLASEKPNLQNLPQESKWSKELRKSFCAPTGWKFISCDYSQLELRLLAHISGDEKLKSAFKNNEDVHALTAAQVFNIPASSVTPPLRKLGKTLNFGIVYGMGPRAFSETANIPLNDARRFIGEYFFDFPQVKEWQERARLEVRSKGFVKNLNGRRRWFPYVSPADQRAIAETERAAINMPIQSLGADILKLSMIKTFNLLTSREWLDSKAKLILTIHDELIFEVSDDILEESAMVLKETMERSYSLSVPIVVDISIGQNLGDMKKEKI